MPIAKKPLKTLFEAMFHGKRSYADFMRKVSEDDIGRTYIRQGANKRRELSNPSERLRAYHDFMRLFLVDFLPVHEKSVFSYRKGVSARAAVELHARSRHFFVTDIESFFPSITRDVVRETIVSAMAEIPIVGLQSGPKLIFIDEIDISLDAVAQARLVDELRTLCKKSTVNVVFTSHSLALMQTLRKEELLYLEAVDGQSILEERSFGFVKSLLFGFRDWDRYILVEDESAKLVLEHLIDKHYMRVHYRYLIIEVGGAGQVISLLRRNRSSGFLGSADAVIAILDGDQATTGHAHEPDSYCMPLRTIEGAFEAVYEQPGFTPRLPENVYAALPAKGRGKALYKAYRRSQLRTHAEIIELACSPQASDMKAFADRVLRPFLSAHSRSENVAPAAAKRS